MRAYRLDQLADAELLRNLASLVSQDRCLTATLLAHIAEVDARRLFAPAGYPSMHAYCVGELKLSEDAAAKRIHAARTARAFPQFFPALAQGRIHLSGLCVLAAHLRPGNADQLLAAATHKTRSEIERLVAEHFPRTEAMALITPVAGPSVTTCQHAPGHVEAVCSEHAPGHVPPPCMPAKIEPIAQQRFVIQVTVSEQTHAKLEQLRALLSHAIPGGELAGVLDYALSAAIARVEKRKFGTTDQPRTPRASTDPRHIPAHVRRAVHARDGGRCTFVADDGHRCDARCQIEFDHIEPIARRRL